MTSTHGSPPSLLPDLTHRRVLTVAVPIVLSNLSTPILGLVDTGIMGQLGDAKYISGVALGSLIFTFLFWAFGFLRMGTTGLVAQAFGAGDGNELRAALARALLIGAVIGVLCWLMQGPIKDISFSLIQGEPDAKLLAQNYFDIRIWSAPFTLANYALIGWLLGQQRSGLALLLQIYLNGINVGLDALFVLQWGWGVEGVALGTVLAETSAAFVGLGIAFYVLKDVDGTWQKQLVLARDKVWQTLSVNRDIMIRTLLLMSAFAFFTLEGARQGNELLAANAILLQLVAVSAYFLDGFAFAAEAFIGEAFGSRDRRRFDTAVRLSTFWAFATSLVVSGFFWFQGPNFIALMTVNLDVRALAATYLVWAAALPVLSVWCYQLDGVFIGAVRTVDMRNTAALSLALFFGSFWVLTPYGNHGLWAALVLFNVGRALTLGLYYPRLRRSVPSAA
ncbi:MAG: MATE family efflux transporter [Parvibaculaceae bacterium]|nr:MATE family efflux transporter [Parvibaculaceae bacterium]